MFRTSGARVDSKRSATGARQTQSQIQDFPKEGARFRVKCHVDAGGGVVAEFLRDLKKPMRFSGGGGVVAEICRDLKNPVRFSGGGG